LKRPQLSSRKKTATGPVKTAHWTIWRKRAYYWYVQGYYYSIWFFIKHFNLEIVNAAVRLIIKSAILVAGFSGEARN